MGSVIYLHEEVNKKNSSGQRRRTCCCYVVVDILFPILLRYTLDVVLRLLRKLTDSHLYPTSLELLRVHLFGCNYLQ